MPRSALVAVLVSVALLAACAPSQKSASGFHLPDGDVGRGHEAFVELRCHACHSVEGVAVPAAFSAMAAPVPLGGTLPRSRTDGELVTAIIDPSHLIAFGGRADVRVGSRSRMGDFRETMTVQQLVDVVAFLHSTYHVQEAMPIR